MDSGHKARNDTTWGMPTSRPWLSRPLHSCHTRPNEPWQPPQAGPPGGHLPGGTALSNVEENAMKRSTAVGALFGGFFAFGPAALCAESPPSHVVVNPSDLKWTDVAAVPGVKLAVIEGPLNEAVPFTMRIKVPADFKLPPHWRPAVEHVTVISGTFNLGMGDTLDAAKTHALPAGSIAIMQPKTPHF